MESLPEEEFKQSVTELIHRFTGECPRQTGFVNLFCVLHWSQQAYHIFCNDQMRYGKDVWMDKNQKSFRKKVICFLSFDVNHDRVFQEILL